MITASATQFPVSAVAFAEARKSPTRASCGWMLHRTLFSARRLGEPETNRALFDLLWREGLVAQNLSDALYAMAGFRNVLVCGYAEVDLGRSVS